MTVKIHLDNIGKGVPGVFQSKGDILDLAITDNLFESTFQVADTGIYISLYKLNYFFSHIDMVAFRLLLQDDGTNFKIGRRNMGNHKAGESCY